MPDQEEASGSTLRREERIKVQRTRRIEVKYKFLSSLDEFQCEDIFDGTVVDLSRGGALLEGTIPDQAWLPGLLDGRIQVGMYLYIPQSEPVKVLGTLRWSRPAPGSSLEENRCEMGLRFEEIDEAHKKNLGKFLIGYLLTKKKLGGSPS